MEKEAEIGPLKHLHIRILASGKLFNCKQNLHTNMVRLVVVQWSAVLPSTLVIKVQILLMLNSI